MLFMKKFPAFLLCLVLVTGMVAAVPAGVVAASDDVAYSESFKQIYSNNYDAIVADYESGYKYVLFVEQGDYRDYSRSIILSKEPVYVLYPSIGVKSMRNSSGAYADSDPSYHSYLPSGLGWYSGGFYQYFASNYDVFYTDNSDIYKGKVGYNARNLPDWFSVAYVDVMDCPAAIPVCNLVPDFYKKDGYLAYYYYKDYPEYAFCVASDSELYVIHEKSDTEQARRFVGRVSDNVIVSYRGTNDVMYVYNRKLGTWSEFNNVNQIFWPWGNSSLVTLDHAYDSLNGGNNFTLLGTNKAIRQLDFDSSGALVSEADFSSGGAIGGLPSFPKAPAPELVGTVQGITWSKTMGEVVGLVPLLLGLVISFLGLRKALRFFSSLLRRA